MDESTAKSTIPISHQNCHSCKEVILSDCVRCVGLTFHNHCLKCCFCECEIKDVQKYVLVQNESVHLYLIVLDVRSSVPNALSKTMRNSTALM